MLEAQIRIERVVSEIGHLRRPAAEVVDDVADDTVLDANVHRKRDARLNAMLVFIQMKRVIVETGFVGFVGEFEILSVYDEVVLVAARHEIVKVAHGGQRAAVVERDAGAYLALQIPIIFRLKVEHQLDHFLGVKVAQ